MKAVMRIRPLPVVPLITMLGVAIVLVFVYHSYTQRSTELLAYALVYAPFLLILLGLITWGWVVHLRTLKRYRTWLQLKRRLARITLTLEEFDVTYLTIPAQRQSRELTAVYESLNNLCLGLLGYQNRVDRMLPSSARFRVEVAEYKRSIDRLENLANALTTSGNFWGPATNFRTTFDILLRPLEFRIRELLFFLEDLPGYAVKPEWGARIRLDFSELVALAEQAAQENIHEATEERRRAFIGAWAKAEQILSKDASGVLQKLQAVAHYNRTDTLPIPDAPQVLSLSILRKTLGLPYHAQGTAEFELEQAVRLAYSLSDQSWRPESQRPGGAWRVSPRQWWRTRLFRRNYSELSFKAEGISRRLDAEMKEPSLKFFTAWRKFMLFLLLFLGIPVGIGIGILLQGDIERYDLNHGFIPLVVFITGLMIGLGLVSVLFLPFLLIRWIYLLLFSGVLSVVSDRRKQVRLLKRELDAMSLDLDEIHLSTLLAHERSQIDAQHLSQRLYERQYVVALRDYQEFSRLPLIDRASSYGTEILHELQYTIALMKEHRQDVENAGSILESMGRERLKHESNPPTPSPRRRSSGFLRRWGRR